VVTRAIPAAALAVLERAGEVQALPQDRPLAPAELRAALPGAAAVVTMLHDRVDDAALSAAGDQLRIVANVAVGYDNIDVPACQRRGVIATNTPGVLVDATADLAMALMLAVTRRVAEGDRMLRAQVPWSWSMSFMLGTGLQGRRLGLIGFGAIGRAVARRAAAFGMDIVWTGRAGSPPPPAVHVPAEAAQLPPATWLSLGELLASSDVVSLHCPLTPDTQHLIDGRALAAMRRDACLVNTARGPIVAEQALAQALADGVIGGAGLDVFEEEPVVHPGLLTLDNVVLTPHLGSATVQTREAMAVLAARNVASVLAGRGALTPVPTAAVTAGP